MRVSTRLTLALSFTAILPIAAGAQQQQSISASAAPTVQATAAPPAAAGPRIESASVAFQPAIATDSTSATQRRSSSRGMGQAQALMIAGGAAVIVGIIIGDDAGALIAVGGAIVGLYGLYQYLK